MLDNAVRIKYGKYYGHLYRISQWVGDGGIQTSMLWRKPGEKSWNSAPAEVVKAATLWATSDFSETMSLLHFLQRTFADDIHVKGIRRGETKVP